MNRLQKKCAIATAGFHLLLLVILFVGPAFFWSREKPDDTQVLDMIPANLVDSASAGVRNAQPPPPAPTPSVTPPPQPAPPETKPIVQAATAPQPTITEKLEKFFAPEPVKLAPATTEIQPHTPKVDLHLVTHNVPKNSINNPKPDSQAIKNIANILRHSLSSPTEVNAPGDSSAASANYGDVVRSVYLNAFLPPDDMANGNAVVKFFVTIASDGAVINARIVESSGDANVDAAVQRMLNRVSFIAPFPNGATEKERTYPINFNATRTTE